MAVGIGAIFILPDFPETWKGLTPEMKRVAVRRLAIDAAEADVDEAGGMSQIRGMKLAFTLGSQLLEDHECGQFLTDVAKNVEKFQIDLSA